MFATCDVQPDCCAKWFCCVFRCPIRFFRAPCVFALTYYLFQCVFCWFYPTPVFDWNDWHCVPSRVQWPCECGQSQWRPSTCMEHPLFFFLEFTTLCLWSCWSWWNNKFFICVTSFDWLFWSRHHCATVGLVAYAPSSRGGLRNRSVAKILSLCVYLCHVTSRWCNLPKYLWASVPQKIATMPTKKINACYTVLSIHPINVQGENMARAKPPAMENLAMLLGWNECRHIITIYMMMSRSVIAFEK